jgi:2,4-diaminopentanoate dehydrogenase
LQARHHPPERLRDLPNHYAAQTLRQQLSEIFSPDGFPVECARKFHYRRGFFCGQQARCAFPPQRDGQKVKKKIRAIQYGVGPIGASIARLMREKQAIEIIGAIDTDPAKAGRDLGEVVGAPDAPWSVKISGEAKDVLEQNADVVIHSTSSSLPNVMDQLLACLEAESSIVSTCEELSYPFRTYPELAAQLDAAAKESGVALVGTGVNPGFVMDKLVVTLAAVSQRIQHAKALRIVDASKRRLPLQKKIGAGMTVEEFRAQAKAGVIKHVGLPESVAMVADSFNLPVEQITETIEPKVAAERMPTEYLTVEPGQAAGVHQIARGFSKDGTELVYLELQMFVGAKDPADTVLLTGHPNISLVIPGGSHGDIATASVVVNSIPVILEARAGLRTSRDLPIGFFSPNARP